MHIPDGFLDAKTAAATAVISAAGFAVALRQAKRRMEPRRIPLMGLAAAFVFAAQMVNFPVAAGTSGHLTGALLVSVLLGPGAAVIVMTSVLVVQCLLFADGGVIALGANVFNMAIVGSVGGYLIYRGVRLLVPGERGRLVATAFSAWCSIVLASIFCAGELAWSGTVAWGSAFPAMANIHMLIGIGEALVSALVIAAVGKTRKDLLEDLKTGTGPREYVGYGLLLAVGVALFIAPFASSWPDGLESVAAHLGFDARTVATPSIPSPLADYHLPGMGSAVTATAIAGAVGILVVFLLSFVLARMLTPRTEMNPPQE